MTAAVELALARDLLESVAEEMAEACVRTASSPNIKERRDLSAAVFDGRGVMIAHAAHIPVHLGAMPMGVRGDAGARPGSGRATSRSPTIPTRGARTSPTSRRSRVCSTARGGARFYVAIRAHHADIGGAVPGSMAPQDSIHAEGLRIPPVRWIRAGRRGPRRHAAAPRERAPSRGATRRPARQGVRARRRARAPARARRARPGSPPSSAARDDWSRTPLGSRPTRWRARATAPRGPSARLGVDGVDGRPARIVARITKRGRRLTVDFAGTTGPVGLGLNATSAVTHSAVYYLVRCLCPDDTPANDGLLDAVDVRVPRGLAARSRPTRRRWRAATSRRVSASSTCSGSRRGRLWPGRFPAPGAGTMSNWTFGPVAGRAVVPLVLRDGAGGRGRESRGHPARRRSSST